ncbi:hypothetical protein BMI88_11090 [Thioclava sp. F36-6]|nr:hypothetical protein BMI88_11090 [Thioclava sp. F36-6]
MFGVLALPNSARLTNRHIEGVAEYVASYPDYQEFFEARQEGYARLGIEALTLAESLAAAFKFAAASKVVPDESWEPKAYLLEKVAAFELRRKEKSARDNESDGALI